MDKNKLISAINQKGLRNSLITIYYNIGRALPFTAQRFPDGRVSEWYKSQYVEVFDVKPGGKGGKYGNAYGFYYRNGKREDSWEDDPDKSWCKKDDTEPQEIPNAACGSWILLDIKGEPTTDPIKVIGVNDVLDFGKHNGKILAEVIHSDWSWVRWAISSDHFYFDIEEIMKERMKDIKVLEPEDILTFGKYKGRTIKEIAREDLSYLKWVNENSEDFVINFKALVELLIKSTPSTSSL